MFFLNRTQAGQLLAEKLEELHAQGMLTSLDSHDVMVLALPRGGVPVGVEISKQLKIPIDVFVVRKIGAPGNSELGIGAVAEGGVIVINSGFMDDLGLTNEDLREEIDAETAELERRVALYRGNRHNLQIENKTVILVDDGLATGVSALAAIRALRLAKPKQLILAAPVCAADTADNLRQQVDGLVCLHTPEYFAAVGQWYEQFDQVTDQEVLTALSDARRNNAL